MGYKGHTDHKGYMDYLDHKVHMEEEMVDNYGHVHDHDLGVVVGIRRKEEVVHGGLVRDNHGYGLEVVVDNRARCDDLEEWNPHNQGAVAHSVPSLDDQDGGVLVFGDAHFAQQ